MLGIVLGREGRKKGDREIERGREGKGKAGE